ncbi:MAG: histidine phosphatase family protein [Deltaproteobacteria bacterium]|nr:histidine phosphatase family protein [Deltaproteobacteria bacterium]
MGRLVLIRHGQASYGQADYDRLSPKGEEQARAVGPALAAMQLDALFVGPHRRQQQTAAFACEAAQLPAPTTLPELAEYPGFELVKHFLPKLVAEDAAFAALPTNPSRELADRAFHRILHAWGRDEWQAEGVERVTEFAARVRRGLETAIASGRKVGVVTSAGPIGVAVGLAFGLGEHRMVRTSVVVRNASISELLYRSATFAWEPEQVSLLTFNSVGHLPSELHTEY